MQMDPGNEPDLAGGAARSLLALRHALADPLSSANLKLDLVERRLAAPKLDVPALTERVRGVKQDLTTAGQILDLLVRLAEILNELPRAARLKELCEQAGVSPPEGAPVRELLIRLMGTADAVRTVSSFLTAHTAGGLPPVAQTASNDAAVRLTLIAQGRPEHLEDDFVPARLLSLPPGLDGAEGLFIAKAVVEVDAGRLDLDMKDERLVAEFSWPAPMEGRNA